MSEDLVDTKQQGGTQYQKYEFFSGLDRSYSSKKRALVLRRHFAERGSKAQANQHRREESSTIGGADVVHSKPRVDERKEKGKDEPSAGDRDFGFEYPKQVAPGLWRNSVDNSASLDTFDVLPLKFDACDKFYINHYVNTGKAIFKLEATARLFPQRDIILRNFIDNAVSLRAMQMYAAYHHSSKVSSGPSLEAIYYQSSAIHLINQELSRSPHAFSDALCIAILGVIATAVECKFAEGSALPIEETQAHINGLREILKRKHGLGTLSNDLVWIVHWIDIQCCGAISTGLTPFSEHLPRNYSKVSELETSEEYFLAHSDFNEVSQFHEEFVGLYRNLYRAAASRAQNARLSSATTTVYPRIGHFFQTGTAFFRTLAQTPNTGSGHLRLAILVYLNILIWDYRNEMGLLTQKHLNPMCMDMVSEGLESGRGGSIEVLFWLLFTKRNTSILENPPRMWLTARVLNIVKEVSWHFKAGLEVVLMDFLQEDVESVKSAWSPESFRKCLFKDLRRQT